MSMGGSGGGGTSGQVTWPEYFQAWHANILGSPLAMTFDVVDVLNAQQNPFDDAVSYDPNAYVGRIHSQAEVVRIFAEALNPITSWTNYLSFGKTNLETYLISETELAAAETGFDAIIDADYVNVTLPRFQRGMQDANAVMSSAFVIGTALLEAEVTRKKAQFSADLRLQAYREKVEGTLRSVEVMMQKAVADMNFQHGALIAYVDAQRINAILKREEHDRQTELDELNAKWDLELFTYAGNLLAAGHGGTSQSGMKGGSKPSALGGVLGSTLTGASMGTSISPGWGTLYGALAGLGFGIGTAIGNNNR